MTDPATNPDLLGPGEHAQEPTEPATGGDTATWHRMSRRSIIVGTLRQLRGLVIPAALILFTGNMGQGRSGLIYIGIALVITFFAAVTSLIDWWNFRYSLTEHEVVVRSGIVQKQERIIPYGRIQAINLDEAPLERLVGIVRVKVETAAGGTADIEIRAIDKAAAPRLREALAAARARARPQGRADTAAASAPAMAESAKADDPVVADALLRRLSTPELLALGATSGRIGPTAAVVGAVLQFGTDIMPDTWWDRIPWQQAEALRSVSIAVSLLVTVAVIAWVLAIASTALTFGGFELRRSGDQLILKHGLLDRRRRTIPIQRIQAVIVGEQLLRQPFRRADLRFESAGGEVEGASGDSGVLFPFLPLRDVEPLLREAAPEFATDPTVPMTTRLPGRSLRRYIVSATVGWVAFVGVAATALGLWMHRWIDVVTWQQVLLLLTVVPIFVWLGWARWRDGGWHVDGSSLLLRWRSVSRQTMITRTGRIQRRSFTADPLQRRVRLATPHLAVASGLTGGHYALPHADRDDTERLMAILGGPRHRFIVRKVPPTATS
jgi:putative membrane protein